MKELQVPFDSAWILKNRRKIKATPHNHRLQAKSTQPKS